MQRGQIVEHRGSWSLLYWDTVYRDGQPKRVRIRVKLAPVSKEYPTARSVRLLADEKLEPINRLRVTPEGSLPLSDFIEKCYFPDKETKLRASTVLNYRSSIYEKHLKECLTKSKIRVRDFRTVDAQNLLDGIHKGSEISHRTLLHIKSFLSGVFKFAKRRGVLDGINPIVDCEAPGKPKKFKGVAYGLSDFDAMVEWLTDAEELPEYMQTAVDVISLLFFTGLRQSEARALRWNDWNESEQTLRIERAVWRTKMGGTKNPASEGTIPVLPILGDALRARRARVNPRPNDYVFAGVRRGTPLDFHNLENRILRPAFKKSGLNYQGFHGFRRGLASNLFELGVNPKIIGAILRHENLATTLEFYTKVRDNVARDAMQQLESKMRERWAKPSGVFIGEKEL
jgi:integrase